MFNLQHELSYTTDFRELDYLLDADSSQQKSKAFFHDKEGDSDRLEIGTVVHWDAKTDIPFHHGSLKWKIGSVVTRAKDILHIFAIISENKTSDDKDVDLDNDPLVGR